MVINGNKPYVNQIVDLSHFNVAAEHYVGVHFGWTGRVTDKWTVGGRLKLINGIAGVRSDVRRFDIGILEADLAPFEWRIDADMTVNTAGIRNDVYTNYWDPQNFGYGLDFGAEYKLNDQFSFAFGVRDLGAIYWRDDSIKNYNSSIDDFRFEGVYYNADDDRTFDQQVEAFTDTLFDVLDFSDTTGNWVSSLPSKWNVGGRYQFAEKQQLGLDYFYFNHSGSPLHAVSLSYYGDYSEYISLRAQATLLSNQGFNTGVAIAIGKYLQFTLGIDYLHYAINLDAIDGVSFGFGLNLNLGYGPKKVKQPKKVKEENSSENP
jgi:long-subunit fatty acid transport protein